MSTGIQNLVGNFYNAHFDNQGLPLISPGMSQDERDNVMGIRNRIKAERRPAREAQIDLWQEKADNKKIRKQEKDHLKLRDERLKQLVIWKRAHGSSSRPDGTTNGFSEMERYWSARMDISGIGVFGAMRDRTVFERFNNGIAHEDNIDLVASLIVEQEGLAAKGILGKAGDILTLLPSYMVPYLGSAKAVTKVPQIGMKAMAKGAIARETTKLGKAFAAVDVGTTAVRNVGVKGLQKIANVPVVGKAAIQLPMHSHMYLPGTAERMTDQVYLLEDGSVHIEGGDESILSAFPKALLDSYIEVASERFGADVLQKSGAWKGMQNYMGHYVRKGARKAGVALGSTAPFVARKFSQAGYDGVLEEMIEERVGEIARGVVGLQEGYGVLQDLTDDELRGAALEQLAAESLAFMVPGAMSASYGLSEGRKSRRDIRRANAKGELQAIYDKYQDGVVNEPEFYDAFEKNHPEEATALIKHYEEHGKVSRRKFNELTQSSGLPKAQPRHHADQRNEIAENLLARSKANGLPTEQEEYLKNKDRIDIRNAIAKAKAEAKRTGKKEYSVDLSKTTAEDLSNEPTAEDLNEVEEWYTHPTPPPVTQQQEQQVTPPPVPQQQEQQVTPPPVPQQQEQQVNWKESKVVDKKGELLEVYHGSAKPIVGNLDPKRIGERDAGYLGAGFYFTNKRGSAQQYGDAAANKVDAGHVYPANLHMKNPLNATPAELRKKYPEKTGSDLTDAIKAEGHDGVIWESPSGLKEYLVFNNSQIQPVPQQQPKPESESFKQFAQQAKKDLGYEGLKETTKRTNNMRAAQDFLTKGGLMPWTTVFFEAPEGSNFRGGFSPDTNMVGIRTNVPENVFWNAVGHEFAHQSKLDKFEGLVSQDELDLFAKRRIKNASEKNKKRLKENPDLLKREAVAMAIGQFFEDPKFREQILNNNFDTYSELSQLIDIGVGYPFNWGGVPKKFTAEQKLIQEIKAIRFDTKEAKKKADSQQQDLQNLSEEDIEAIISGKKPKKKAATKDPSPAPGKEPTEAKKPKQDLKKTKSREEILEIEKALGFKARKQRAWLVDTGGRQQVPDETSDKKYATRRWKTVAELVKSVEAGYPTKTWENYLEETGLTLEEAFNHVLDRNVKKPPKKKSNKEKAAEAKSEFKDTLAEIKGVLDSELNVGLNPKLIPLITKLVKSAFNEKIYKFADFIAKVRNEIGDNYTLKIGEALREAWGNLQKAFPTVLDKPTSVKEIINGRSDVRTGGSERDGEAGSDRGDTKTSESESTSEGDLAGSDGTVLPGSKSDNDRSQSGDRRGYDARLDAEDIGSGGPKTKYKNNVAAIKTLRLIEEEDRNFATEEERKVLAKYVGWGMFPVLFEANQWKINDRRDLTDEQKEANSVDKWEKEREEIKDLLSKEEFEAAHLSTINAHYTSPQIVKGMWEMLRHAGYKGGLTLEPSSGTGNFIGFQPEDMAQKSQWTAVEMDILTSKIQNLLYPSSHSINKPYQNVVLEENLFDLAISNVPFGNIRIKSDRKYKDMAPRIHDYFFLKALDQVRPGGIVAAITSTGTMDKKTGIKERRAMARKADLIAAYRFPDGAFQKNAGTAVVTDLLIFKKREEANTTDPSWIKLGKVPDPDGNLDIPINQYFIDNPGNVLGTVDRKSRLYRKGAPHVSKNSNFESQWEEAVNQAPENYFKPSSRIDIPVFKPLKTSARPQTLFVQKGVLYEQKGDQAVVAKNRGSKEKQALRIQIVKDIQPVREKWIKVVNAQLNEEPEDARDKARSELRKAYEGFSTKHGPIREKRVKDALYTLSSSYDNDYQSLAALEKYIPTLTYSAKSDKEKTYQQLTKAELEDIPAARDFAIAKYGSWKDAKLDEIRKYMQTLDVSLADIFHKDTMRPNQLRKAETLEEAARISRIDEGRISTDVVAELLGTDLDSAKHKLDSSDNFFYDPVNGYVFADEYLSGDVRTKLDQAREAVERNPNLKRNIDELKKVIPENVPIDELSYYIGSAWIPSKVRAEFLRQTFKLNPRNYELKFHNNSGKWFFRWDGGSRTNSAIKPYERHHNFAKTFENTLRRIETKVYVRPGGRGTPVDKALSAEATKEQAILQRELASEFKDFVIDNPEMTKIVEDKYAENFRRIVRRKITYQQEYFPGMNPLITLTDYQQNAVGRSIERGNAIFAHEVGAGKTFTMIATAMELKRLGLKNKSAIVVPNQRFDETVKEIEFLYPNARIFAGGKSLNSDERAASVAAIAQNNYDIVVMTHHNLLDLPVSLKMQEAFLREQVAELTVMFNAEGYNSEGLVNSKDIKNIDEPSAKEIAKKILKLREDIADAVHGQDNQPVHFEMTGIDNLIIDESHMNGFKSMNILTSYGSVKGVPTNHSSAGQKLEMLTQYMHDTYNGRGVFFATGTPVTNSLAEIYVNMKHVQRKLLEENGVLAFDAWVSAFAEPETRLEINHAGNIKNETRLTQLPNPNELFDLVQLDWDFVSIDDTGKANERPFKLDKLEVVDAGPLQKQFLDEIFIRAQNISAGRVERAEDNHLDLAREGSIAAVDIRMVKHDAPEEEGGKLRAVAEKVGFYYKQDPNSTQFIFMEETRNYERIPPKEPGGKSKRGRLLFDAGEDLKDKLVAQGIPREKIVDFRDSTTENRQSFVDRLKAGGDGAVAIGSTDTLGTGVDAPERAIALHHLSPSWTPHAKIQRDGRVWRQGNPRGMVYSHTYITAPSMDRWKYGLVARKDISFKTFFSGERMSSFKDVDANDIPSDFAVASAMASGDPLIFEELNLSQDVIDLGNEKQRFDKRKQMQQQELGSLKDNIGNKPGIIENMKKDLAIWEENKDSDFEFEINPEFMFKDEKVITEREKAGNKLRTHWNEISKDISLDGFQTIGKYKGFNVSIQPTPKGTTGISTLFLHANTKMYNVSHNSLVGDGKPKNIWTQVTKRLNEIGKEDIPRETESLEEMQFDIDSLETQLNRGWREAEKLEMSNERLRQVTAELNEKYPNRNQRSNNVQGMSLLPPMTMRKHSTPDTHVRRLNKFVKWFRRWWKMTGLSDKETYRANERRKGRINAVMADTVFNLRELTRAINRWKIKNQPSPQQIEHLNELIDSALTKQTQVRKLPQEIAAKLTIIRGHIDDMSEAIVDSGMLNKNQMDVFKENYKEYINRSYRVFNVANYTASEAKKKKARDWLVAHTNMHQDQIESLIRNLSEKTENPFVPAGLLFGRTDATPNTSILKERSELLSRSKPLRELMGEYTDYQNNYLRSVHKQVNLLVNYQFIEDLKRRGVDHFLFKSEKDVPGHNQPVNLAEIFPDQKQLHGLYAEPHVVTGLKDLLEMHDPYKGQAAFEFIIKVMNYPKLMSTVYSHPTQFRNFVSNGFIATAQGHLSGDFGSAINLSYNSFGKQTSKKNREEINKLIKLRVLKNSFHGEVLNEFNKDFQTSEYFNTSEDSGRSFIQAIAHKTLNNPVAKLSHTAYQMGDEIWKIHAFRVERARYKEALPGTPSHILDEMAAEIVLNTFPTYSRIPKSMNWLRKFPLTGPFVAFPWEINRTQVETVKLIMKEYNSGNPVLRKIAKQRIAGMFFAHSSIAAASLASATVVGIGDDELESASYFLPDWMKNSTIFWLSKNTGLDFSYLNPFSIMHKPIVALYMGLRYKADDLSYILSAVGEYVDPYVSYEIALKAYGELLSNKYWDKSGQVYNSNILRNAPLGSAAQRNEIGKIVDHIIKINAPGTYKYGQQMHLAITGGSDRKGRTYDLPAQIIGNFIGRPIKIDVQKTIEVRTNLLNAHMRNFLSEAKTVFRTEGRKSPQQLKNAISLLEDQRKVAFNGFRELVQMAIARGYSEKEISQYMKNSGASTSLVRAVMDGEYEPFKMSRISQVEDIAKQSKSPERAKQFAEMTGGKQVIENAVGRSVENKVLGKSSPESDKILKDYGDGRGNILTAYKKYLRAKVERKTITQKTALRKFRKASQLQLQ